MYIKKTSCKIFDSFNDINDRTISVLVSNDKIDKYEEDFAIMCCNNEFDDIINILNKLINVPSLINISLSDMYLWFADTGIWKYDSINFKKDDSKLKNQLKNLTKNAKKVFLAFEIGDKVSLNDISKIIDIIDKKEIMFGVIVNQVKNDIKLSIYTNLN